MTRPEAYWAEWFDAKGYRWDYEPRVYAGRGGQYLPDFLVYGDPTDPDNLGDAYVEVKPTVEAAQRILPRMQVIWESVPDAFLVVFCDRGWYRAKGDVSHSWEWTPNDRPGWA